MTSGYVVNQASACLAFLAFWLARVGHYEERWCIIAGWKRLFNGLEQGEIVALPVVPRCGIPWVEYHQARLEVGEESAERAPEFGTLEGHPQRGRLRNAYPLIKEVNVFGIEICLEPVHSVLVLEDCGSELLVDLEAHPWALGGSASC